MEDFPLRLIASFDSLFGAAAQCEIFVGSSHSHFGEFDVSNLRLEKENRPSDSAKKLRKNAFNAGTFYRHTDRVSRERIQRHTVPVTLLCGLIERTSG